jgi:PDZ domain-containing protein
MIKYTTNVDNVQAGSNSAVKMVRENDTRLLFKSSHTPVISGVCSALIILGLLVSWIFPSPYIIEKPGITADVLGSMNDKELITYQEGMPVTAFRDDLPTEDATVKFGGEILLLTVSIFNGPGNSASNVTNIPSLFQSTENVLPQELIYSPNMSASEVQQQNATMMSDSQSTATTAAFNYLHGKNAQGDDISPENVIVSIDDVGGPSAGLAFTLGIVQKVGGVNLTKGRTIAVTGTIDEQGNVGRIGGVQQKMISAVRDGATVLLVPTADVTELTDIPDGVAVYAVNTLQDAITALGE